MGDTITVSSGGYIIPVSSATVSGNSLAIAGYQPGGLFAGANYEFLGLFYSQEPITLVDSTTGNTYVFSGAQTTSFNDGYEPGGYFVNAGISFSSVTPPFQGTLTGTQPTPCFATGTLIATAAGATTVETLTTVDEVILATGGTARVTWVGHRRQVDGTVIRVRAHALGHHSPERDLVVSADHGLYLDGVLIPAGLLVNGETIVEEHRDAVVLWHVELEQHGILLAENAAAESYLDTGNRRQFGNCSLAYDPIAAVQDPCAEMVFAGERLDQIRARLPLPA